MDRLVIRGREEVERILQECHLTAGGHRGRDYTIGKVKACYYWPNYYKELEHRVRQLDFQLLYCACMFHINDTVDFNCAEINCTSFKSVLCCMLVLNIMFSHRSRDYNTLPQALHRRTSILWYTYCYTDTEIMTHIILEAS